MSTDEKKRALAAHLGVSTEEIDTHNADTHSLLFGHATEHVSRLFRVYRGSEVSFIFSGDEWFYITEVK